MKERNKEDKISKKSIATKVADIISIVVVILLLPILAINSILIIKGAMDKTTVPSVFGFTPLVVQTNSMAPVFYGGDLILIQDSDVSSLQKDDIIAFYEPTVSDHSVVVSHRIVGVINNEDGTISFRTKGDANNAVDTPIVPESEVIGKYKMVFTGVGSVVNLMSTTKGMLLFVVLPLIVVFATDSIIRTIETKKKNKKENITE